VSSQFDNLFASMGVPGLLGTFGTTITYTTAAGASTSIQASLTPEETRESDELGDGRRLIRTREATIATDPTAATGGVADPRTTDTLTAGGVKYAITHTIHESGSMVTLGLVRYADIHRHRDGQRRRTE
jgi:hypothetical protein